MVERYFADRWTGEAGRKRMGKPRVVVMTAQEELDRTVVGVERFVDVVVDIASKSQLGTAVSWVE